MERAAVSTGGGQGSLRARLGQAILPAGLLIFGLVVWVLAGRIDYVERAGQLGPGFWPRMLMVLLMIHAAGLVLVALRGPAPGPAPAGEAGERGNWPLLLLGGALVLGYVVLSGYIGFLLSTALFLIAFLYAAGYRHWSVLPTSLVGSLLLVLLFVRVVYVSLPTGVGVFDALTTVIYTALGIY